jgi:hypothetical protein
VSVDARGKNLNRQAAKIAGGGRGEEDFGFWILDFGFWILDFGWKRRFVAALCGRCGWEASEPLS